MKINFRQGIVSHQTGFLSLNADYVELSTSNRATTVTVAHKQTNYLFSETQNVTGSNAWGPIVNGTTYWLYWDFNPANFERSFGFTTVEPIAQSVEPGQGDTSITAVVSGDAGIGYFVVDGFYTLPAGRIFTVSGSVGNDGTYTVGSTSFNTSTGKTTIVPQEAVIDDVILGTVSLDTIYDSNTSSYLPAKTNGRMWYNTASNIHYQYNSVSGSWLEVLRVFSCKVVNGSTILPYSISGTFTGTQIGNTSKAVAGRIIFTEGSNPIKRNDGTFFTTEDKFFAHAVTSNIGAKVDAIRLETNLSTVQIPDQTNVGAFKVVAMSGEGIARVAQYNDTGSTIVGVITNDITTEHPVASVVFQGIVTNPDWDFSAIPVGSPLWISGSGTGTLVSTDPHVSDIGSNPTGQVPVARILSSDTILFEQGLGGKGDRGPSGIVSGSGFPIAAVGSLGVVSLTTPSSVPELALVPSDQDPRLSNARTPLPHSHTGASITFTPSGSISANTVDAALRELDTEKVSISGSTMTGFLTLNNDPSANLHAATKQYVDSLVNGFTWIDPICLVNLISDTVSTPPGAPQVSDAYIMTGGATGAWAGIPVGDVVVWDGSTWLNRGDIPTIDPAGARIGVSLTSSTPSGGSFAGQEQKIAVFNAAGTLTSFENPVENNAVYVCKDSSLFAFSQLVFDGSNWVLTGGGSGITADEVTITQTGSTFGVVPLSVNAAQLEGNDIAALDLRYAGAGGGLFTEDANGNIVGGSNAGESLTTGIRNFVSGLRAGRDITTGNYNVAIGKDAGKSITVTHENVAIGHQALELYDESFSGFGGNVAIGPQAGQNLNNVGSATMNVMIGRSAGGGATTGEANVAIGAYALNNGGGSNNVAIGNQAAAVMTGFEAVAIGPNALLRVTTGIRNVGIGKDAGSNVTTGQGNVSLGWYAGRLLQTSSQNNICIGHQAGPATSAVYNNQLFIHNTVSDTPLIHGDFTSGDVTINGNLTVTGTAPGGIGFTEDSANGVLYAGNGAAASRVSGQRALILGANAVATDTTTTELIVIGSSAGRFATNVGSAVIIGNRACEDASSVSTSVVIGEDAVKDSTGGVFSSVLLGYDIATSVGSGSNINQCIIIGDRAGGRITAGQGSVIIGNGPATFAAYSNQLWIGGISHTDTPLIHGLFTGTPKVTINGDFEVTGTVTGAFGGGASLPTATITTTTIAQTPLTTFDTTTDTSAKFIIQAKDSVSGEIHVTELIVTFDGTTALATEYGTVFSGAAPLASYDVDVLTTDVRILVTAASTNSTKFTSTAILVGI